MPPPPESRIMAGIITPGGAPARRDTDVAITADVCAIVSP